MIFGAYPQAGASGALTLFDFWLTQTNMQFA